jgi:hypothetical protein
MAPHYFKISDDEGNPIDRFHHGMSLLLGIDVPFDSRRLAHSFTLPVHPRGSHEQCNPRGFPMKRGERLELETAHRRASAFLLSVDFKENADFAATDFAISRSTFSAKSQSVVAWMSEHGIGICHRSPSA